MQYRIRIIVDSTDGVQHNETNLPLVEADSIHAALATVTTAPKETTEQQHARLVAEQSKQSKP